MDLLLRGGADGASIYGNFYRPFFFLLGLVMAPIRQEIIQLAQEYKKNKQRLERRYLTGLIKHIADLLGDQARQTYS